MWAMGYSLDNLSLMALTISVGFVVDDAIVMLENITRYIEDGEAPLAAALKGASEIGFTIISISVSLIAVLIPLLLMGGIIGRLFREFAVTLSMAIAVSAAVSLTLTPMMASRFLTKPEEGSHGRIYQWSEHAFDMLLKGYERGLDLVLQFRLTTLSVFLATMTLSVYLYVIIPKGFFPEQDTNLGVGTSCGCGGSAARNRFRFLCRFLVIRHPAGPCNRPIGSHCRIAQSLQALPGHQCARQRSPDEQTISAINLLW